MKEIHKRFNRENIKGKMAEVLFREEFLNGNNTFPYINGKTYKDVSDILTFQNADVDVLFYNKDKANSSMTPEVILKESHWLDNLDIDNFIFYEIKFDSRINDTRHFLYEVLKKDKPGRMAKSKADIIVCVPITNTYPYKFYDYFWVINTFKMRTYIRQTLHNEHREFKKLSNDLAEMILNGNCDENVIKEQAKKVIEYKNYIVPYNYELKSENIKGKTKAEVEAAEIDSKILNLWLDIDKLVEIGAATKVKISISDEQKTKIENTYNNLLKNG